jgi:hypothetical protein
MALQKFHIIGEFSSEGYNSDASWRPTGICSFPNEIAACLTLIYCYLVFTPKQPSYFFRTLPLPLKRFIEATGFIWFFLFFAFVIVMTGSRIAIAAIVFTFMYQLYCEIKNNPRRYVGPIVIIFPIIAFLVFESIMNTDSLFRRSAKLFSMENVDKITMVWDYINPNEAHWDELHMTENIDKSWWIRLHKWAHAVKLYVTHPETWLFGVGPGLTSAALDGGLLRIFIEQGLIGAYVYWRFYSQIYHKTKALQWMVIVWVINNIFIDIYLTYKPMSLLFLVTGYAFAEQPEYDSQTEEQRVVT